MTNHSGVRMTPFTAVSAAIALLALGASGMYAVLQTRDAAPARSSPGAASAAPASAPPPSGTEEAGPLRVTLSPEALARAGVRVEPVATGRPARSLRVPGVVEPNGYRTVMVTALAAGQLTDVRAELGQRISPGDVMAEIYSPELAQAEREYISMRADLAALRLQVERLERLTAIGAASQQELERERAEATRAEAEVEGARARLSLLGLAAADIQTLERADQIDATMEVPATSRGVVTARAVNRGQNVNASQELFTVVDLSSVWVVGDVYERDVALVQLGNEVVVTAPSLPDRQWRGRVSYIDPQIAMATRTARVRVEVENAREELRLGMFADLVIEEAAGRDVVLVPRAAVQTIGPVDVVYLPDPGAPGVFVERPVRLGRPSGEAIEVLAGLSAGESVVTSGSFPLRAERERLGLPAPASPAPVSGAPAVTAGRAATPTVRRYEVAITDRGLEPATVTIPAGTPVEILFVRRTENTCGTDVVLPDLGIDRNLPLNEPVAVAVPPQPAGVLTFACSMGMLQGRIVVVAGGDA